MCVEAWTCCDWAISAAALQCFPQNLCFEQGMTFDPSRFDVFCFGFVFFWCQGFNCCFDFHTHEEDAFGRESCQFVVQFSTFAVWIRDSLVRIIGSAACRIPLYFLYKVVPHSNLIIYIIFNAVINQLLDWGHHTVVVKARSPQLRSFLCLGHASPPASAWSDPIIPRQVRTCLRQVALIIEAICRSRGLGGSAPN